MSGQIKAGFGTLIGNAGEYYVMAELLKRNVVAALAPRNAPWFDILATHRGRTARIRVKTKSEDSSVWQWVAKKDRTILSFPDEAVGADVTVLVYLAMDTRNLAFFVIPSRVINDWLMRDFEDYISVHGPKGPRNPESRKRNLHYKQYEVTLSEYRDRWDLLWV
jgi:hypothetical protein